MSVVLGNRKPETQFLFMFVYTEITISSNIFVHETFVLNLLAASSIDFCNFDSDGLCCSCDPAYCNKFT